MSWFSSKTKVLPLLTGFTDMHCHVLPGIDDGSPDVDTSYALLERYRSMGMKKLIPTPHIMHGTYPNTPESITGALNELKADARWAEFEGFVGTPAAEYMLDEETDQLIAKNQMLPLSGQQVLVEFSWHQRPLGIGNKAFNLQSAGYAPILAHPERYLYFSSMHHFEELKEMGFVFQLNLLSLSDHYGKQVRENAFALLKKGHYTFAGTDTHRLDHLSRLADLSIPSKLEDPLRKCLENSVKLVTKTF